MAWTKPQYTSTEINAAAKGIIVPDINDLDAVLEWAQHYENRLNIVNNFRAVHAYPLNTFQINLRSAARKIDDGALIAQRTKRLASISIKLARFPKMKLSQMQDIGGCRAVLKSVAAVRQLDTYYAKVTQFKHKLSARDDYITSPKPSGYRGIHYVYRYFSDKPATEIYNGLKIEMQLRSLYQHAWATAVETVGTFIGESLKTDFGPAEWKRFFALMGSVIAIRERSPTVPGTPSTLPELIEELRFFVEDLHVTNRLTAYGEALRTIEDGSLEGHFFVLKLYPAEERLVVTGYPRNDLDAAQQDAALAEVTVPGKPTPDVVLVSVDSVAALRRAYPNYFADTRAFVQLMNQALSGKQRRIFSGPLKIAIGS